MRNSFLLILIFSFLLSCEKEVDEAEPQAFDKQLIIDLVNDYRTEGCQCGDTEMPPAEPLRWDDELAKAAQAHSDDMQNESFFSHTGSDGSSFSDRIKRTNYEGSPGGENIASGHTSEQAVIEAWIKSEGHCRNIMNPDFTAFGLGRSENYWTQVFGRE